MKRALIGAGGHAKEVMMQMGQVLPCFVDDEYVDENSLPISSFDPNKYEVLIAIGDSESRCSIVDSLPKETQYFSFIHHTSIIGSNVSVGEGSFIGAFSIITTDIQIGKHTLLNRGNHIGHDSKIGDYFSMMPCAVLGGNVTVGNNVYMGSCSNIREKINVTSNVVIGMNSAVVKNITKSGTYVGVPCKKLNK